MKKTTKKAKTTKHTFYNDMFDPIHGDPVLWEDDHLIKAHRVIHNRLKRAKAFKEHQEHTLTRRGRIAQIVGCSEGDIPQLLKDLKRELEYVKP